jgi:hypothetical protein
MTLSALIDFAVNIPSAQLRWRAWTPDELDYLRGNLHRIGCAGVGQALGRTAAAVKVIQVRRQIAAASKRPGYYTANQAARILGVDIHSLSRLEELGLIHFDVLPGKRAIRQISRVSLWVWAIHPDHWIYFKPARVRDPRLRRLIALRQAKWGDAWWTTGQVAAYYGLAISNTVDMAIYRGRLSARKWGNWYVKKSDALAYHFTPGKGKSGYAWSPRADAFILLAHDEWGLSWSAIGRLMKWPPQRCIYRYKVLTGGLS